MTNRTKLFSIDNMLESSMNNKSIKVNMNCIVYPPGNFTMLNSLIFFASKISSKNNIMKNIVLLIVLSSCYLLFLAMGWKKDRKFQNGWKMKPDLVYPIQISINHPPRIFSIKVSKNWSLDRKLRNRQIKSINGNGRNSFNLVHWNLGPRHWRNKTDDIQLLVDDLDPDIVFISEANLWQETEEHEAKI